MGLSFILSRYFRMYQNIRPSEEDSKSDTPNSLYYRASYPEEGNDST